MKAYRMTVGINNEQPVVHISSEDMRTTPIEKAWQLYSQMILDSGNIQELYGIENRTPAEGLNNIFKNKKLDRVDGGIVSEIRCLWRGPARIASNGIDFIYPVLKDCFYRVALEWKKEYGRKKYGRGVGEAEVKKFCVYLIDNKQNVKIGFSSRIRKRVSELNCADKTIYFVELDSEARMRMLEKKAHHAFYDKIDTHVNRRDGYTEFFNVDAKDALRWFEEVGHKMELYK